MPAERNETLLNQKNEDSKPEKSVPLFARLIPILFVDDLEAERDFYVQLGFTVSYQGLEFPDFIALASGSLEFGLELKHDFAPEMPDRVLIWQFGVTDIETAKQCLTSTGLSFRDAWVTPREDWKYRVLHTYTPNGYHLMLEGAVE